MADGGLRLRRRPAAAAVRLHPAAVAVGGRRVAGGDRADREYRPGLFAEIPLGAAAGPDARRPGRCAVSAGGAAGCWRSSRRWWRPRRCWRCPTRPPLPLASLAAGALVAFLSASQDIVVDAWRIEVFPARLQGAAMAAYVWGYRVALLIATTGVIAAAGRDRLARGLARRGGADRARRAWSRCWHPSRTPRRRASSPASPPACATRCWNRWRSSSARPGAWSILAFVALFKLGEAMAGIMTAPFYRALGFSRDAIAATGPFSLVATLAGITLGGWLVARIGVGRALLWTGWAQTVAMAMYVRAVVVRRRAPRAVRHRRHRGVRPGHGGRGVHHLPVRALLDGVHRDALRAAVVARGTDGAHDGRILRRAGAARWGGRGSTRCACSPRCRRCC